MHATHTQKSELPRWRLVVTATFFCVCGVGLIGRLYVLQIIEHSDYLAAAERSSVVRHEVVPKRGEIFFNDKNGVLLPVAINKQIPSAYVVPREVQESGADGAQVAEKIATALSLDPADVLARVSIPGDPYEPLKKRLTEEEATSVEALGITGVHIQKTWDRSYPLGDIGAQTIGFLGFEGADRAGQYGVEGFYDAQLQGQRGIFSGALDGLGRLIPFGNKTVKPMDNGDDIVLTLDQNVMFSVRDMLKELNQKYRPMSVSALVMNPKTGAVIAMDSLPSFDPNTYADVKNPQLFLNPLVHIPFEPGSVMKPIAMAAGLDTGVVTPESTFNDDKGYTVVADRVIRNAENKVFGVVTMTDILKNSINTGIMYVQQKIGKELFLEYMEKFGFARTTGIDIAAEKQGSIANLYTNRDVNYATAAFGQGISVTPVQLLSAINAIANEGNIMKPHVIAATIHNDVETAFEPVVTGRAISADTANRLTAMMVTIVDDGQARGAKVLNYFIAGKTGTAQVPVPGGYADDRTIHTYVGFAPAFDPRFSIAIKLEAPSDIEFASQSVAPSFGKLAKFLLDYYQIPPER